MKNALVFACAWLVAIGAGFAQSSEESAARAAAQAGRYREALAHYTSALQGTVLGSAEEQRLAEEAIRAAQNVKPAPPIPDDARRFLVRGTVAIKEAKSAADFDAAAKEFGMAIRAAPWWPDPYFNQSAACEAAGRYNDAIRALKLYVLAAPGAADLDKVKDRIYALEYRHEKAGKDALAAKETGERRIREEQAKYGRWLGDWRYESSIQWPGMAIRYIGVMSISRQSDALEGRLRYTGRYYNGEYAADNDPPVLGLRGTDARGIGEIEWAYLQTFPAGSCYKPAEWRPVKLLASADNSTISYSYALSSLHHQTCAPTGFATMSVKLTRGQ